MSPEQIVALLIGGLAIWAGVALLPIANAIRRLRPGRPQQRPIVEVTVSHNIPRDWRAHVLPWFFIAAGAALVLIGALGFGST